MATHRRVHVSSVVARSVDRLEALDALDGAAVPVRRAVASVLSHRRLRGMLSGSFLGHPLHPLLTDVPLGCWTSAVILDIGGRNPAAARRLIGVGVLAAAPTALSGWSDWLDTDGAEQRIGLVHALSNIVGVGCLAGSWMRRRRGEMGTTAALAGLAVVSVGGWLGGHLAYRMGVGVDANAFETGPDEWTAVAGAGLAEEISCHEAAGVRVVVLATKDGVRALADRCSHRGGPLSEGAIADGCIECPWHRSRFDPASGEVRRGPATAPQPVYEVRVGGDVTEVRRSEPRALRRNTVRA